MADKVSWIKKVGRDIVKGFAWLASDKGRAVIAAGETVAEIAFPPSAPIIDIVNVWIDKVSVIEAKAQAASDLGVNASSAQKATAAIAAVAPDVEAILLKYNLLKLSEDSLKKINDAVLTIANELEPAPAPAPAA
jgi:hypothetical protein